MLAARTFFKILRQHAEKCSIGINDIMLLTRDNTSCFHFKTVKIRRATVLNVQQQGCATRLQIGMLSLKNVLILATDVFVGITTKLVLTGLKETVV